MEEETRELWAAMGEASRGRVEVRRVRLKRRKGFGYRVRQTK